MDKVFNFDYSQSAAPAFVTIGTVFAFWVFVWTRDVIFRRRPSPSPGPRGAAFQPVYSWERRRTPKIRAARSAG